VHAFSSDWLCESKRNLYGTTYEGGNSACSVNGCGVVYKMTSAANGSWTFSTLHGFDGSPGDGALPYAGIAIDAAGNLYGTTYTGGAYGYGTVYEVTPHAGEIK
jgi:uncharacterized repeat protein (TIGR03803 family)